MLEHAVVLPVDDGDVGTRNGVGDGAGRSLQPVRTVVARQRKRRDTDVRETIGRKHHAGTTNGDIIRERVCETGEPFTPRARPHPLDHLRGQGHRLREKECCSVIALANGNESTKSVGEVCRGGAVVFHR